MTGRNRAAVDRSSPVGSTYRIPRSAVATQAVSRQQAMTPTPQALREEAIDYCLQCASYDPAPDRSDRCVHWDTCEKLLEQFPTEV